MSSVLRHLGAAMLVGLLLAAAPGAGRSATVPVSDEAPLRRHGIDIPAKPRYERTLYVCEREEVPDCYPTPAAALIAAPAENVRILIFCGTYERDAARLNGRRNLVIEGVPCPDGSLPVLDADGAEEMGMGPFPWFGPKDSWALWVEKLELRGARVGDGNGTPFRLGGAGPVVFHNVIFRDNENGILASSGFDGTLYVIDSVFRDNGYGKASYTHHIYNGCHNGCTTVVLDSYFGRLHQGGNHIRVRGNIIAVGNMFVDEPGSRASRMINASVEACRMENETAAPPCLVAHNYMLKGKQSENPQFINFGDPVSDAADYKGMVVRDNVALGLRFHSVLIGDFQSNARVEVRDNLLVVQDRDLWCADRTDCLLGYRRAEATQAGNVVSDDPAILPTDFPNLRGLGPGH
jgi:hypothetical protein